MKLDDKTENENLKKQNKQLCSLLADMCCQADEDAEGRRDGETRRRR